MAPRTFLPDLLYAAGEVRSGQGLTVDRGVVTALGPPPPGAEVERLPGLALLPGLVSAHGHAFQRALRGRTQWRAPGRSTFWSWREVMYRVALAIGPDELHAVARLLFLELALSGATAVGEFHYLHLDPGGHRYADPDELARRVLAAAREVGLRTCLLRVAYGRAGFGRPADPAQRRFVEPSPDEAVAAVDRLSAAHAADPLVSFGLAPHSVRACPEPWIAALARAAAGRGLPLHAHASEQPREVEECRAEHGLSPVGLLARAGALGPRTTLVHAIHVDQADVAAIGAARATVCACPTTERDLGDGIVPADRLLAAGARLALGVDAGVEADLLAEARAVEGHLRLAALSRGALGREGEGEDALARRLHGFASAGGMAALGLDGGALRPGEPADMVALDLSDPALAGAGARDLLTCAVFSGGRAAVRHVWVAGEAVVRDRAPTRLDAAAAVVGAASALAHLRAAAPG
ncbi:MAG TPA: formimidoylglutamate deiminase [Anaeromyxobacteraceae bacterium]|nr:formimidoylglutamate deiminase [Anaeromyxobacteraceae bacterium]